MSIEDDKKQQAKIELAALITRISRATSASELAMLRSSALGLMAEYGISDGGSLDIALANGVKLVATAQVNNPEELKALEELKEILKEYQEVIVQKAQCEKDLSEATKKLNDSVDSFLKMDLTNASDEELEKACKNFHDIQKYRADCIATHVTREELLNKELRSINREQEFLENQHKQLHKPKLTDEEKKPFDKRREAVQTQQIKNQKEKAEFEKDYPDVDKLVQKHGSVTKDNIADFQNAYKMKLQSKGVDATNQKKQTDPAQAPPPEKVTPSTYTPAQAPVSKTASAAPQSVAKNATTYTDTSLVFPAKNPLQADSSVLPDNKQPPPAQGTPDKGSRSQEGIIDAKSLQVTVDVIVSGSEKGEKPKVDPSSPVIPKKEGKFAKMIKDNTPPDPTPGGGSKGGDSVAR